MAKPEETAKPAVAKPAPAPQAGGSMAQGADVKVEPGDVAVTIVAAELKPFIGQALGGKKIPENAELPGAQEVLVDQNAMSKTGVSFNLMFPKPEKKGDEVTAEDRDPKNVRKGVQHDKVAQMLDKSGHGALADQVSGLGKGLQLDPKNQALGVTMRNNLDRRAESALKLEPGGLAKLDYKNQSQLDAVASNALQVNAKLDGVKPGDKPLAAQKLNAQERDDQQAKFNKGDPKEVVKIEVQLPQLHMPKHRETKLAQTATLFDNAVDAVDPRQLQQPGGRQPGPNMSAMDRSKFPVDAATPSPDGPAPKPGVEAPQPGVAQPIDEGQGIFAAVAKVASPVVRKAGNTPATAKMAQLPPSSPSPFA